MNYRCANIGSKCRNREQILSKLSPLLFKRNNLIMFWTIRWALWTKEDKSLYSFITSFIFVPSNKTYYAQKTHVKEMLFSDLVVILCSLHKVWTTGLLLQTDFFRTRFVAIKSAMYLQGSFGSDMDRHQMGTE